MRVSVIVPVYNSEKYIAEVRNRISILQTLIMNFYMWMMVRKMPHCRY